MKKQWTRVKTAVALSGAMTEEPEEQEPEQELYTIAPRPEPRLKHQIYRSDFYPSGQHQICICRDKGEVMRKLKGWDDAEAEGVDIPPDREILRK